MIPRRGSLYWVVLDKRRPALVISPDYRNEYATDVMIVPCSTRLMRMPTHVLLDRGEGGLKGASALKCEQLTTISKAELVAGPLGPPLSPSRLMAVERAIIRAIGVPLP